MILKDQAKNLLADETFLDVFVSMRTNQCNVFLHSKADEVEKREEAHAMLRALNEFENVLKRVITDQDIKDKRLKKQDSTVETTTPVSVESAAEALLTPMESEATEVNETETEVAEVEETEVEQESELETDDDAEYAELEDEDNGEEYEASDEQEADQSGPEMFAIKVDGENVQVTLDDLKRDYSGQQYIQKGMKQAAEQRKQAEEAYNGLNQQREQLNQFMQQLGAQGVLRKPTPPTKDLLSADPLGYIEADATYREEMGAFQAQQQQIGQHDKANKQAQDEARQVHLQSQMSELKKAIPEFGDATKATKMKEKLVKQGVSEGYSAEEISGIVDHRAMKVLHKAMMYDQMVAGNGDVQAKLKKARPLMKAGTKKLPDSAAKKQRQQLSKLKKSGSIHDAAALLFNS